MGWLTRAHVSVVLLLATTALLHAEDVVRHSGSTYLGCQNIGDSSVWLTNTNSYASVKPGFLYIPQGCAQLLPAVPERYRKIDLGQVVEMSQAEKDAVDAPVIAEAALQQSYTNEIAANDLCDATLDQLITRIDTEQAAIQAAIDASSNLAQAKTAMTTMNTKVAAAFKKVARCLRARAR